MYTIHLLVTCFVSGRASATPSIDLLITLLSLGVKEYSKLLEERKQMVTYLSSSLAECADKHGERLLQTKNNPISLGNFFFFSIYFFNGFVNSEYKKIKVKLQDVHLFFKDLLYGKGFLS